MISTYNPQQQALIDAPINERVVGVAGAGTGKTTTILARTKRILNEYATGNILVITFTRAAANDLRTKIMAEIEDTRRITVGTFHSIMGNLIRDNAVSVGLEPNFTIIDEKSTNIMYRNIAEGNDSYLKELTAWALEPNEKKLGAKHFNLLARSVSALINMAYPEELMNGEFQSETKYRLQKVHKTINAENIDNVISLLYRVFKDSLLDGHRTNTVTYDHILFIGYLMVKNHTLDEYAKTLAHTIVDEYQDTNLLQDAFIRAVGQNRLTIVGDIDQAIYEFRGGKPSLIVEHAKEAKVYNLAYNYRSYQPILDLANNVIQYNKIGQSIRENLHALKAFDENFGGVTMTLSVNDKLESDNIVDKIRFYHDKKGVPYQNMAVLIRSRMTLPAISRALSTAKIPVNDTTNFADFMKSDILTDALNFLKVFTNPKDIYAFLGVINRPKQGIGPESIKALQAQADAHQLGLVEYLLSDHTSELTPARRKKVETFINTYQNVINPDGTSEYSLSTLLENILSAFGYVEWVTSLKGKEDKNKRDLITLRGLVKEFEEVFRDEHPNASLYDIANAFVFDITGTTREEHSDGVCITTIHNAKGLEWDYVFLLGLEDENFPGKQMSDESDMESERRLMYVGLTRAKVSLHLYMSQHRITSDSELTPSIFISEMDIAPTHVLEDKQHG